MSVIQMSSYHSAMEFVAEAAKLRAVTQTGDAMAVAVVKPLRVRQDKKKKLYEQLLEGTVDTTAVSEVSQSTVSTISHLEEFIGRKNRTPTLKVIGKRESPYPRYDVLGEFLAKVPQAEEQKLNTSHECKQPVSQVKKSGTITAMIDLKKHMKSKNKSFQSSDKENQPANCSIVKSDSSFESARNPARNLQPMFDLEKERQASNQQMAEMFEEYKSTPSKSISHNATCLDPVQEQPEQQQASKMSIHHVELVDEEPHIQRIGCLSISEINQIEQQQSQLLDLQSIILEDLKNDIMKLTQRMSSSTKHRKQSHLTSCEELDYAQLKSRVDGLRHRIYQQHDFLQL